MKTVEEYLKALEDKVHIPADIMLLRSRPVIPIEDYRTHRGEHFAVDFDNEKGFEYPGGRHFQVIVAKNEKVVHSFTLCGMPQCCGICVSTLAYTPAEFRGRGVNTLMNILRQKIARENGYSQIICTVTSDNVSERSMLYKNGWQENFKMYFRNSRTQHDVCMYWKNL